MWTHAVERARAFSGAKELVRDGPWVTHERAILSRARGPACAASCARPKRCVGQPSLWCHGSASGRRPRGGYFVKTQDYFSEVDSEAEKIRQKLIQKLTIARSRSGMPNQKGIKDSLIRQLSEGKLQTGITLHYCRNKNCQNSPYLSAYNFNNPGNIGAGHKCPGLKKGKTMRGLVCKSNLQIDFNVSVLE